MSALAGAALVGLAIGFSPRWLSSDSASSKVFDSQQSVQTLHLPERGTALSAAEVAKRFANSHDAIATAAPNARTAVQRFLDGEIARDDARSYGQLSAADRMTFPTVDSWSLRQSQSPQLLGARITSLVERPAAADVRVELRQRAQLDEVLGLVPARADARYHAVHEDGGWRVSLGPSHVVPDYTDDDRGAEQAAQAWAYARADCSTDPPTQWRTKLYGDGADLTATRLCGAQGPVQLGPARALVDADATAPLLAAFGPDVGVWARVVPLRAPISANLVLAPVGERWLVVAVLGSSSTGGKG